MEKLKFVFLFLITIFIVPLYVLIGTTPAGAGIWPGLTEELCMADAYLLEPGNSLSQGKLNCTANDVEITRVIPIDADGDRATNPDGSPNEKYDPVQCTLGQTFELNADITIRTNANERWDTTFYLPLTEQSPQVVQDNDPNCSIVLPNAGDIEGDPAEADLDLDECSDITKAFGPDEYTLEDETITMFCADEDGDKQADFTYCAAWDNQERDNCTGNVNITALYYGQIPNTKSKCNCDTFNIPVFIAPEPPIITKTVTPLTGTEPYQDFLYTITIEPGATTASSIFIRGLYDIVSSSTNIDGPYTFALNNGNGVGPGNSDVGSTQSFWELRDVPGTTCDELDLTGPGYEIAPESLGLTCNFVIRISDEDLPDIPNPELFQDFVQVKVFDENGDPVGEVGGNDCSAAATGNCSNEKEVSLTNVSPTILVTKTVDADPGTPGDQDQVTEGTHTVYYTVVIENTSDVDAVTITNITDSVDGGEADDLAGDGDCQVGTTLELGESCDFTYEAVVTGNTGDVIINTVWAYAVDNENDTAQDDDNANLTFTNSPGAINLVKTAVTDPVTDPPAVTESGDWVRFYFEITNKSDIDNITLDLLDDDQFGVIFDDEGFDGTCDFYGDVLIPDQSVTCYIERFLSGEPGVDHVNTATVYGNTGDYIPCNGSLCLETVMDTDDATVKFINEPADITFLVDMSLTLFVTISNGSTYESVFLDALYIDGVAVADGTEVLNSFIIHNEGGTYDGDSYPACAEDLGTTPVEILRSPLVGSTYTCAFTVELIDSSDAVTNLFRIATGADLGISVSDEDGLSTLTPSVNVKAQLTPNL